MAKILLVDDEAMLGQALKRLLTHLGHEVVCVTSGDAALKETQGRSFDLVLSDTLMPGMHGVDLVHALRAQGFVGSICLMSGFTGDLAGQVHDLLGSGIVLAFLQKPFGLDELRRVVAQAMQGG